MCLLHNKTAWMRHSGFFYDVGRRCRCFLAMTPQTSSFSSSSSRLSSSLPPPRLGKVLVANRGEIACRVLRTCRQWGIPTVAVYSHADGPQAWHATLADEAVCLGDGPTPAQSYLLQDELLQICTAYNVHAVHPGYGFLSENATFAQAVSDSGLVWIGPPAQAIHAMGDKAASKAIMDAAGVPTTPGYYENATEKDDSLQQQDPERLRHEAQRIGYPVLIKAVAGGGGKGMRVVWQDADFLSALQACQREARHAVGNDTVLLEKYLHHPRHIEVQVVADKHGNVVSLHERDCSLQRRHQKIIEEAPAVDLPLDTRAALGAMARQAALAVDYVNAGTVEFLLDTQAAATTHSDDPNHFYFCEMNTRLQVEHPVTEAISGVDLVEWQLRVAAGEVLPVTESSDIACVGHAFEARIYAEQPARDFLPATGTVWHHVPPVAPNTGLETESGLRVDTGLPHTGGQVSVYYDPLISKLIVHGPDRKAALTRLVEALRRYQIAGVPSNVEFLIQCAQHPVFGEAGAVNTGFLEHYAADVQVVEHLVPPALAQAVGAWAALRHLEGRRGPAVTMAHSHASAPWSSHQGSWRMGGKSGRATRVLQLHDVPDSTIQCTSNRDGSFEIQVQHTDQDKNKEGSLEQDAPIFHIKGEFDADKQIQVVINHTKRMHLIAALKEDSDVIRVYIWPDHQSNGSVSDTDDALGMWQVILRHPYSP